MFHFHKWNEVVRKRTTLARTWYGYTLEQHIPGLKVLEVCRCGKTRAWLIDDNGKGIEKVPETLFNDEELKKAKEYLGELNG